MIMTLDKDWTMAMALMRTRMTCLILMFPTLVSGGCSAELSGRMLNILSNDENDYYYH